MAVRIAILNHIIDIAHFLLGHHIPPQYCSVQDYIQDKGMDQNLGHRHRDIYFSTSITNLYSTDDLNWCRYSPHYVDRTLNE